MVASGTDENTDVTYELYEKLGYTADDGKGFMLGIECEKPAKEVIASAMEKGVLVLSAKTKVRLLPPLNIQFELLEDAMDKLIEAIEE